MGMYELPNRRNQLFLVEMSGNYHRCIDLILKISVEKNKYILTLYSTLCLTRERRNVSTTEALLGKDYSAIDYCERTLPFLILKSWRNILEK